MESDVEIIWLKRLCIGENKAYEKLYSDYFFPLSSFAIKYLENKETAEEVVQDVFFEFWKKKAYFDNIIALKTYFYRSVRNRCLDILRHNKVKEKYLKEQSQRDQSIFFLHAILEEEVFLSLKKAIDELPGMMKEVYHLSLIGYDNSKIATILNISLDSVKSYKKRGKKLLKSKLKNLLYLLVLFYLN